MAEITVEIMLNTGFLRRSVLSFFMIFSSLYLSKEHPADILITDAVSAEHHTIFMLRLQEKKERERKGAALFSLKQQSKFVIIDR